MPAPPEIRILALGRFPEVTPGMDLPTLIRAAAAEVELTFQAGDILVVDTKDRQQSRRGAGGPDNH